MSSHVPFMATDGIESTGRVLYTPSDFAKNNLNYLQEAGTLNALRVHEAKRSGLSSYLFFMVTAGSGNLTVKETSYPLKAGDCVFVDCMTSYRHKPSEELWQLKWVHFSGPMMAGIYDKYLDRGGKYAFTPSEEKFKQLSCLLTEIREISASDSYVRDMEINEKLAVLITELMRCGWDPDHRGQLSEKRKDMLRIRDYIDTHFAQDISLDSLAQAFYINKFYLTRLFKEQFGTTVNKHLTGVRITNAKKLLRFSDLTVEQIGERCGYGDANFFIRTFKRCEGMTPGEFRSKWNR